MWFRPSDEYIIKDDGSIDDLEVFAKEHKSKVNMQNVKKEYEEYGAMEDRITDVLEQTDGNWFMYKEAGHEYDEDVFIIVNLLAPSVTSS